MKHALSPSPRSVVAPGGRSLPPRRVWPGLWPAALALAFVAVAAFGGGGPAWVIKSRSLRFADVFAELWTWIQAQWNDVLPIIVVAAVIGIIVTLLRVAHGRHEGHQGGVGKIVLALVAALFMTGIVG